MTADDDLTHSRVALANGDPNLSIRLAWSGAQKALRAQDSDALHRAMELASTIESASTGRVRKDAARLSAYCNACLTGAGNDVSAGSFLERMLGNWVRRTKKCPDCAEKIAVDARVCRFCGYRYAN